MVAVARTDSSVYVSTIGRRMIGQQDDWVYTRASRSFEKSVGDGG